MPPYRRSYKKRPVRRYKPKKKIYKSSRTRIARKVSARAPMVETKAFEVLSTGANPNISIVDGSNILVPIAYTQLQRGYNDNEMIGRSIFSKYLTVKLEFDMNSLSANTKPVEIVLRWGWVTARMNENEATTPGALATTQANIVTHVTQQVSKILQNKLEFSPKLEGVRVLGQHRLRQFTHDSFVDDKVALQYKTITWKPMRKVTYTTGATNTALSQSNTQFPNRSWIPFIAVHAVGVETATTAPTMASAMKHWFSDS